ncbi:MAG: ThiF family adenylyltransferase [Planctomycetota bacterium]
MSLDRYSRQVLFAGIGAEGQEKLLSSKAVLIGCGALGTVIANTLARAGVGSLRIIDRDFVDLTNLQRQVLFDESDVAANLPKAEAARRKIRAINSDVAVEAVVDDVDPTNVVSLVKDADVILDGSDNFQVRYLINDAAISLDKPWIYGAAVGSYGLSLTVRPKITPCLRCLFPAPPPAEHSPTCDSAGVLGSIIGVIASIQSVEAIKILTGQLDRLSPYLTHVDVWDLSFRTLKVEGARESSNCPACFEGRLEYLNAKTHSLATTLCGRNSVQISPAERRDLDLTALEKKLQTAGTVMRNPYLVRLSTGEHEITVFANGRAIVSGTEDTAVARTLYARWIGD